MACCKELLVFLALQMKDWRLAKAIIDQDVWITARDDQN
jgi:hypothetical protein